MRNILYRQYQKKHLMAYGGNPQQPDGTDANGKPLSSAIAPVAAFGSSLLDATDSGDKYGYQKTGTVIGKGALSGASMGSSFGPYGAGIGAVLGAGIGLINAGKQKREETELKSRLANQQWNQEQQTSAANIAADPTRVTGRLSASYFKNGGYIKYGDGGPGTKKNPNVPMRLNGVQDSSQSQTITVPGAHSISISTPQPQQAEYRMQGHTPIYIPLSRGTGFANGSEGNMVGMLEEDGKTFYPDYKNTAQRSDPEIDMGLVKSYLKSKGVNNPTIPGNFENGGSIHIKPSHKGRFNAYKERTGKTTEEALHSSNEHVRQMAQFAKNASTFKHENGGDIKAPLAHQYMTGGSATSLSSNNTEINGPSHAQGGVEMPQIGAELEGNETTAGNFVFSKKLGFANLHKPIAKAIGTIEQKPQTVDRLNALDLLRKREQNLAMSQEYFKHLNGIQ